MVIADINIEGAQQLADEINITYGEGKAKAVPIDVTKEEQIIEAFEDTVYVYGGVDILVNNAGLATSSPFEETTLTEWNLNMNVLGTGYFLVSKEAFNSVLPDAVLQGSAIWGSKWREERAAAYGIHLDQLEEHYRQRTVLKENIYPIDIAEAVAYFASPRSTKTTGCMITVDGGVTAAFMR